MKNLGDLVDRSRDLDRVAVIDLGGEAPREFTHREMDRLANAVVRILAESGLPQGAAVAVAGLNSAEYAAAYLGIMRSGRIAVPLNIKLPKDTVEFILADANVAMAFADSAGRSLIPTGMPVHDLSTLDARGALSDPSLDSYPEFVPEPDTVAQLLYTSGSSGRPKGVPLTHRGQLWALEMRMRTATIETARYIIAQPLFHMNGLFSLKTTFASNASVVILPGFDARTYLRALAEYRVTSATAVPTMWARALKETDLLEQLDFSAFRRLVLGSAPMTQNLLDRLSTVFPELTVVIGYGTTEAGPMVFGAHPQGKPTPHMSTGFPVPGTQLKLVGGTEDQGVLVMRNPAVMPGYRNLPEKSAEILDGGWYYSGDVFRRDKEGFYYFVERADDMFVCAGENIFPGEVEKLLERHPEIQQAAVVPLPDEERSQIPVAFLIRRPGSSPTADDIRAFAIKGGPAYQHPRHIAFLEELPWAGTNKIDRKSLMKRAVELTASHGWD